VGRAVTSAERFAGFGHARESRGRPWPRPQNGHGKAPGTEKGYTKPGLKARRYWGAGGAPCAGPLPEGDAGGFGFGRPMGSSELPSFAQSPMILIHAFPRKEHGPAS
jgi:hypothetical protein